MNFESGPPTRRQTCPTAIAHSRSICLVGFFKLDAGRFFRNAGKSILFLCFNKTTKEEKEREGKQIDRQREKDRGDREEQEERIRTATRRSKYNWSPRTSALNK